MRDRRFGVEIECLFPGGSGKAEKLLYDKGFHDWTDDIHDDGSGTEIPSPILQGAKGFAELKSVMAVLKDAGAVTTNADGLHVHHDAPEFVNDDELTTLLVETWAANQDILGCFVAPYRRNNYWACHNDWTSERIAEIRKWKETYGPSRDMTKDWGERFSALNLRALDEHGSIEFRQMEGTLDFAVARSWILFGQALLDAVKRRKTVLTCADSLELLRKTRTAPSAVGVLMAKVGSAVNPPDIYDVEESYNDDDFDDDDICRCCRYCCGICGCCCGCP